MASRDDASRAPRRLLQFPDTVRVLAAMVQFQPDNDGRTTGNGQFAVTPSPDSTLDAPPRDRQYFRDHLAFLENYYRKVSRGKVIVVTTLIDSVITLPTVMATYSPPKTGSNIAVANLARDAWHTVDSAGLVPDFSRYHCFVIFHAGVGRDIDLVSTLGYDPTPLDIPSLYIGLKSFQDFYGSGFRGIPVNGATHVITNSTIIPETETRPIPGVAGDITLELTINGLLCASFGNFLGLPDLFDTKTGRSGIGRFGLMDGQAIFSFSGAFPPEPSAWEKYWLGWIEPIVVQPGTTSLSLPAIGLGSVSPSRRDTVYRVPIGGGEYFLVENRNRDPLRNGQTVTSRFRGAMRQQVFPRDTIGFSAFDISALDGVIMDVEDPDWSLPGGVDDAGVFYDGGALIWHIDEGVINQNLSSNGVNADPKRRGVDVEEADGSQDIGQQYGSFSAGSGSEEGTALDFWYQGNSSPVNKNVFSPTSYPDSRSNAGANSHVTIRDFSARGTRMTATVVRGDVDIRPLPGFPKRTGETLPPYALAVGNLGSGTEQDLVVTTTGNAADQSGSRPLRPAVPGSKIFAWKSDGSPVLPGLPASGLFAASGDTSLHWFGPASIVDVNGDGVSEVIVSGAYTGSGPRGRVQAYSARNLDGDTLADLRFSTPLSGLLSTGVAAGDSLLAVGGASGTCYLLTYTGATADSVTSFLDPANAVIGVGWPRGSTFAATGGNGSVVVSTRTRGGAAAAPVHAKTYGNGKLIAGPPVGGAFESQPGAYGIVFATRDGSVVRSDTTLLSSFPGFPTAAGDSIAVPPALADIDGDGRRDIVVFAGSRIFAFNDAGAHLSNFPIAVPSSSPLSSAPIVADVDGDGLVDIVGATSEGFVVAYNRDGQMAKGFPLQAGRGSQTAAVFFRGDSVCLAVASSDDGSVSAWVTGKTTSPRPASLYPWLQYQRDERHSGSDMSLLSGIPVSSQFFPKDRAYNWPNPVHGGTTFIRYFVKENSGVRITIFDIAGDLVTELSASGIGGIDNEVSWDTGGVQSGIYFARIEANGAGGSGVAIVKIAVVK